MKFDAQVTVCAYHGTDSGIRMYVYDQTSGTVIVELQMTFEEFGRALSAHGYTPARGEFFGGAAIGCKVETKTIDIEHKELKHAQDVERKRPAEASRVLKPYEVDGWIARTSDLYNPHCSLLPKKQGHRVSFSRFVKPDGTPLLRAATDEAKALGEGG